MTILEDLLLNIFFITFLPLLFVSTLGEKLTRLNLRNRTIIGNLVAAFSAILCMMFPVHLVSGFIFDLRQIPIILGCLYLGYKNSIILIILPLLFRFTLGGEGFQSYLLVSLSIYLVVPWFHHLFFKLGLTMKVMTITGLSVFFSAMALALAKSIATVPLIYGVFVYTFMGIQLSGMLLVSLIFEYIIKNMQLREELIKAAKLQTMAEMSASVSHEIRNPLAVSRGFLQLLQEPGFDSEDRERYIKIAIKEIDRATEIIDDYLVLANPYPEQKESVNLTDELHWLEEILQPYSNMHSVLIRTEAHDSILLDCERRKIRQVFVNLGKNAIESMPDGGTVLIGLTRKGNTIEITFQDNGCGMDQNQLNRLGEPYFTTKTEGTGLGMMVVWRIVQSMGGKIQATSQLGKGTDITVILPSQSVV
ncbi:ATP-binding protein [Bacillus sp. EB01]|uniref:ATP-binding protein n=1 Tax=Bacillus sp. EB01 TaxID=1347086 RepID=UPI0005C53E51|nr:ATP-binding protein [Bacillus sp. EB01]